MPKLGFSNGSDQATRPKAVLPHSQQEIEDCPLLPATARGIRQVCRMPRAIRTRERLSPYGTFVAMRKPVASKCQQMPKPSGFRGGVAKAIPPFPWLPANPKQNTSLRASGYDKRSSTRGCIKRSQREGEGRACRGARSCPPASMPACRPPEPCPLPELDVGRQHRRLTLMAVRLHLEQQPALVRV